MLKMQNLNRGGHPKPPASPRLILTVAVILSRPPRLMINRGRHPKATASVTINRGGQIDPEGLPNFSAIAVADLLRPAPNLARFVTRPCH